MPLTTAQRVPLATYRLQLRREFPFADATKIVPYVAELGVSDFYCSPVFLSTPGSAHGYDVNDYRRVNPDLGGRKELERLHARLREHGMGVLLDFVPNHMGINGPGLLNTWWRDVLEHGEHSAHAEFFDIDWNAGTHHGRSQVLVPILEDHYGRVLEAGKLALVVEDGGLNIAYYDMRFPLSPHSYPAVLRGVDDGKELAELSEVIGALPSPDASEDAEGAKARTERFSELKKRLRGLLARDEDVRTRLEARLAEINGEAGEPGTFDALDDIIQRQHYRLAYWKAGVHETNYRRFFAIDTLIGLRMENPAVFYECHTLLAELVREGIVTGLRIDHVDGLRDPRQYLDRLQNFALGDAGKPVKPLYVVVEKILESSEPLPREWATHGTTGYEFIEQLAGVLVDSRAERRITETYGQFCGEIASYEDVVYAKKRIVLDEMFANAVTRLAHDLTEHLQTDRCWRDVTRNELTVAVREIMAAFPVYRTYRRAGEPMSERDRAVVERACTTAIGRNRRYNAGPFELVRDVLVGAYPGPDAPMRLQRKLTGWVMNFQQYTGAVMAKSVEDTAFYTYSRFIALNEVGGNPGQFGGSVGEFHAKNAERLRDAPHALLATSTHDTKVAEDVRARLYALSEMPHAWRDWLAEWSELNRVHKTVVDGRPAPDPNEEYRLYQVLLGAWPADDAEPDETFRERMKEHWRKAVNEAKRNTSWVHPNEPWLEAGERFLDAILQPAGGRQFLESFRPQARRLARFGMVNSLAQVTLKITSPGVPDFYQGTELWDFSLVDPDNRRPVDFESRQRLAEEAERTNWRTLLAQWEDGAIKLRLTRALLKFRAAHAELFRSGAYQPLEVRGRFSENVVAYSRSGDGARVMVVVPRLTSSLGCPPLGLVWDDTAVATPEGGRWKDVLTGRELTADGVLALADVFGDLPVAVLVNER
jgi:malto-oligosyltrehalose synthase